MTTTRARGPARDLAIAAVAAVMGVRFLLVASGTAGIVPSIVSARTVEPWWWVDGVVVSAAVMAMAAVAAALLLTSVAVTADLLRRRRA